MFARLLLILYAALLVYGTWFPINQWSWDIGGMSEFLATAVGTRSDRSDVLINSLVYVPLGWFAALTLTGTRVLTLATCLILGSALSFGLELGQTYLPGRVSSLLDIALNIVGTMLGAGGALFFSRSATAEKIGARLTSSLRRPGTGHLGALAVFLWAAAQTAPWVPSPDLGTLKFGIAPFRAMASGSPTTSILGVIADALMFVGLTALALRLFRDREAALRWIMLGLAGVLIAKIFILTRQLSPGALFAFFIASISGLWLRYRNSTDLRWIALGALISFQLLDALTPVAGSEVVRPMNWLPLRGHMNTLNGIFAILEVLWLFTAYAYLLYPRVRSGSGLAIRLSVLIPFSFLCEWLQQYVPGRFPDITDVLLGGVIFSAATVYPWRRFPWTRSLWEERRPSDGNPNSTRRPPPFYWPYVAVAALVVVWITLIPKEEELPAYALPAIEELPAPRLESFRFSHPRLPAPSRDEIDKLNTQNPAYLNGVRKRAEKGGLYDRTLLGRIDPSEIDFDSLFNDIMQLEPKWRGHEQTLPIALAYDWLYEHWSPFQRAQLLQKSERACEYQIQVIREKGKLSPYNVYLYNSPLQALVAVALAIHGDTLSGDCMRFTYDYWLNRVLPVWKQVMGRHGGWHEGGEYVGVGIGQAVYRIPAMWRSATGEDIFAKSSGLRGFLDFEIYRTRPDGTHMRLGDAAYFTRRSPDLAALALEYGHAAAYSLAAKPTVVEPKSYPWGPLGDPSLWRPESMKAMPLAKYFDGIGLLIARSDWSSDATYVTFKAGQNYWSHSHLDQGAFTIFKGRALALDSGLYTRYGGEHHMNYTYQSVAHNVVTVTNIDEATVMPAKRESQGSEGPRHIANDGGQRRVGSGWGRPAPLDINDWNLQKTTYQTVATTLQGHLEDEVIWKTADLTPAYTNRHSSEENPFDRSRRVEAYQRTFIYLRKSDTIVVYDRVLATSADYRKRWLLHSQNEPEVDGKRFQLRDGTAKLDGLVLLPVNGITHTVGGPGFEYYVDGRNYDEDGRTAAYASKHKRAEPGAWRLQLLNGENEKLTEYLVALRPSLGFAKPLTVSKFERSGDYISLEIEDIRLKIPRSISELTWERIP